MTIGSMVRQIALDTETTGLEVEQGHRVIEIGAVELVDRRRTGRHFHRYLNPERAVSGEALRVHGLDDAFLAGQPRFAEVADEFLAFLGDAELLIHNAAFDVGFLDAELARSGHEVTLTGRGPVLDTLKLARAQSPTQRASLDALCRRYQIDHAHRDLHGALKDAELLAQVYLAMTAGQIGLLLEAPIAEEPASDPGQEVLRPPRFEPDAEALAAHQRWRQRLEDRLGRPTLWAQLTTG